MGGEPFSEGLLNFHAVLAPGGHQGTAGMASPAGPVASGNIGTAGSFLASASVSQALLFAAEPFFKREQPSI
jgi:hypothetical protein